MLKVHFKEKTYIECDYVKEKFEGKFLALYKDEIIYHKETRGVLFWRKNVRIPQTLEHFIISIPIKDISLIEGQKINLSSLIKNDGNNVCDKCCSPSDEEDKKNG